MPPECGRPVPPDLITDRTRIPDGLCADVGAFGTGTGHTRIAVIGIPCQIYALRAPEVELEFERINVIGAPCSDNTTTAHFHDFLALIDPRPERISYLEFRGDYRVEIRFDDGRPTRLFPFLKFSLSTLPADFFPMTCKTCVDYTNRLSDIPVGYMGGDGDQWVIVRNDRGAELLAGIADRLTTKPLTDKGERQGAVRSFMVNTEFAAGGLPLRRMPDWLRPFMANLQPHTGPKGLEFARARVKNMVPGHVWKIAARDGLTPGPDEVRDDARRD